MNDRIQELVKQSTDDILGVKIVDQKKFAELIVQDTINLLREEWYKLNNQPEVENETPRDVGLRVGCKSEVIVLIEKIKQHYGVDI